MIFSLLKRTFFALLIGLFPILYSYAHNIFYVPLEQVVAPIIIILIGSVILISGFYFLYKDLVKASILVSIFWLLFFSYNAIHSLLTDKFTSSFFARHSVILASISLLFLLFCLALKNWRIPKNFVRITYAFALVLLLTPTLKIAFYFYNEATVPFTPKITPEEIIELNVDKNTLPDIVYIILDGYGREDILKKNYGLDNSFFIQSLKEEGFFVAENSYSNYCRTAVAAASVLNLNYLQDMQDYHEKQSYQTLDLLAEKSYLIELLKRYNYNLFSFASGFSITELKVNTLMLTPLPPGLKDFHFLLLSTTPFIVVYDNAALFQMYCKLLSVVSPNDNPIQHFRDHHRQRMRFALNEIPNYLGKDSPSFVFADIFVGHPPFIFDENGNYKAPVSWNPAADGSEFMDVNKGGREAYIRGYREQLVYLNKALLLTIENIKKNSTRSTIIMLQGDHGPGAFYDQHDVSKTDVEDRFSILTAIYLSDDKAINIPNDLSPVNTFRLILNSYFNTNLPLLPNRSFYSGLDTPCKFIEVTNSLKNQNNSYSE